MVEKRCPKCGEVKPLSGFHRNKSSKDGRHAYCKPCTRAAELARQARRRTEMGEEAWLAARAEAVRKHRERTGNAGGKRYSRAVTAATRALIEAHRAEYDARLRLALDELERVQ